MTAQWVATPEEGSVPGQLVVLNRWFILASPEVHGLGTLVAALEGAGSVALSDAIDDLGEDLPGVVAIGDLSTDPIQLHASAGIHVYADGQGPLNDASEGFAGSLDAARILITLAPAADVGPEPVPPSSAVRLVRASDENVEPQQSEAKPKQGERPGGGQPVPAPGKRLLARREPSSGSSDDPLRGFALLDLSLPARSEPLAQEGDPTGPQAGIASETDHVEGKRCKVGHLNHPAARFCYRCGRSFQATGTLVVDRGPRPPLGVLVDRHGQRFTIDRPLVLGRRPQNDDEVRSGRAVPITASGHEDVSRVHVTVAASGWDVMAVDRSTNGTQVWTGGGWQPLRSGEATSLVPGATLRLGSDEHGAVQVRYLSHHLENEADPPEGVT